MAKTKKISDRRRLFGMIIYNGIGMKCSKMQIISSICLYVIFDSRMFNHSVVVEDRPV
jgi:hypothetical protein